MSDELTVPATQGDAERKNLPAVMGAIETDDRLGYIVPRTIEEAYGMARLR